MKQNTKIVNSRKNINATEYKKKCGKIIAKGFSVNDTLEMLLEYASTVKIVVDEKGKKMKLKNQEESDNIIESKYEDTE